MPGPGNTWGEKLLSAISDGLVEEEIINDKVTRILKVGEFSGRFKSPKNKPEKSNIRQSLITSFLETLLVRVWFY